MNKTFRYRIFPAPKQTERLERALAICAELYNAALQERRDAWKMVGTSISYFDQTLQLAQIKSSREDVADVNANVLENVLKRVHLAFGAFFRRSQNGEKPGYPRFRSEARYNSITFRQIGNALKGNKVRLSKIGNVRIKLHRPLKGTIKTLTIKRESGRWYALFCVECDAEPLPFNPNTIGIDVGITTFATTSDGRAIENPRWFRNAQPKLKRLQRRVSRRTKDSHRKSKALLLLQRWNNHIRNQRRDFHHKESRKIVNANGLIAVEDLNVKALARSCTGKSVHDAGWASFFFMLAYKAESAGRVFVKVDPRGTSQTCTCGAEVRKTLSQRWHLCLSCGLSAARDHVSAQIILSRAGVPPLGANVGALMPCVA